MIMNKYMNMYSCESLSSLLDLGTSVICSFLGLLKIPVDEFLGIVTLELA